MADATRTAEPPRTAEVGRTPYIGLARLYRPQTFADLVGQDQIGRTLAQQVQPDEHGNPQVAQAYIFSGPRGVGKTSTARILAKSLNCLEGPTATPCGVCKQCVSITTGNSMDVIEIDGASNNSVNDIRDLQETINQNPFSARRKIYIIDEVHMLSLGAFNALLKTLEEPPPFVVFVLATTAMEKIPETIKSRCQALQFNRISIEDLVRRLEHVAEAEDIAIEPTERRSVFEAIAFAVDGGMRDALMALDQLRAVGEGALTLDEAVRFLGIVEHDLLLRTVEMLHQRDTVGLLQMVAELVERGRDLERFVKNLLGFLRDLMVLKAGGGEGLVNLTGEKMARARGLLWSQDERGRAAEVLNYAELLNFVQMFMALEADIKEAVQVRIHLEFAFVKLTAIEPVADIATILRNFDRLTGGGGRGAPAAGAPPAAAGSAAPGAMRPAAAPVELAPAAPASPPRPAGPPQPSTPDLFGGPAARDADAGGAGGEANTGSASAASAAPAQGTVGGSYAGDSAALWQAVLARRQELGAPISITLASCALVGVEGNVLRLALPRRSLSLASFQDPTRRERMESLASSVAGMPMRLDVRLTNDAPGGASGGARSGASAAATAPAVPRSAALPASAPVPPASRVAESSTSRYSSAPAPVPRAAPRPLQAVLNDSASEPLPEPPPEEYGEDYGEPVGEMPPRMARGNVPRSGGAPRNSGAQDATAPADDARDANALFREADPATHARDALSSDGAFRDQVRMVQRFFEGRIFDTAGGEILLES